MVKVYGYKKWSTVLKSLKFLEENALEYEFFDFVVNQIDKTVLEDLIKRSHEDIEIFFSKKGVAFKELALGNIIDSLSYQEKLDYLLGNGKLLKRPIIDFGNKVFVGFKPAEISEYLQ